MTENTETNTETEKYGRDRTCNGACEPDYLVDDAGNVVVELVCGICDTTED